MGGVAHKLLLCVERLIQPQQHLIDGTAQPAELHGLILTEGDFRQTLQLHAFCLCGKALQRLQRLSADEIRHCAAQRRHRQRDVPAANAETVLRAAQLQHELSIEALRQILPLLVRNVDADGLRILLHIVHHIIADGVHIGMTRGAQKRFHGHAGSRQQQNGQQCDSPLQRKASQKSFHGSRPPIRYPSPMRFRIGS